MKQCLVKFIIGRKSLLMGFLLVSLFSCKTTSSSDLQQNQYSYSDALTKEQQEQVFSVISSILYDFSDADRDIREKEAKFRKVYDQFQKYCRFDFEAYLPVTKYKIHGYDMYDIYITARPNFQKPDDISLLGRAAFRMRIPDTHYARRRYRFPDHEGYERVVSPLQVRLYSLMYKVARANKGCTDKGSIPEEK